MRESSSDINCNLRLPGCFTRFAPHIERALDDWLPGGEEVGPELAQSMRYSVFSGGKRVRPVLTLLACEIIGGDFRPGLPAACAVEFIHSYSLIHDDLPCMDDDDLRRGKPTNHRIFGEAMAVLAGDALQSLAFEVLSHSCAEYSPSQVREMTVSLARACGGRGMVGGQVRDIEANSEDIESLSRLHAMKTGALFRASLDLGGTAGGATLKQRDLLRRYADAFGLAFQITDDILDVIGDPDKTGRYAGSDEEEDRCTYPAFVGVQKSRELAGEAARDGMRALCELKEETRDLQEILNFVLEREG